MKKTLLACAALSSVLLAGCDDKPKPSDAPVTTVQAAASSAPSPSSAPRASASATRLSERPEVAPPATASALAANSNAFAFDLWARHAGATNFVVGPSSISSALVMTWTGAKGKTAEQMQKVLHLGGDTGAVAHDWGQLSRSLESPRRASETRIADRLFGEKTYAFDRKWLELVKNDFGAPLEPVDFKNAVEPARAHINGWVSERTNARVHDLLPAGALTADTALVLVDAIWFHGDWAEPFEVDATRPAAFHAGGAAATKDVPTMHVQEVFKMAKAPDLGATVLAMPYKNDEVTMLLVLPDKVDGLPAVEKKLTAASFAAVRAKLAGAGSVEVALPKFAIDPAASIDLVADLKGLGMVDAFDKKTADFTGMATPPSPDDRLYVTKAFHKGFVKVDENGTEAAAATAVVEAIAGAATPQGKPAQFIVDRPFLFAIVDESSGLVLFLGRVVDPSAT